MKYPHRSNDAAARVAAYAEQALSSASRAIATAAKGSRNETLFREAVGLAGLIAGEVVSEQRAESALRVAAERAGVQMTEFHSTWQSARRIGFSRPRYGPNSAPQPSSQQHKSFKVKTSAHSDDNKRIAAAQAMVARARPLGALVGSYLAQRGLPGVSSSVLFEASPNPRACRSSNWAYPAMLAVIFDELGKVACVQRTALDPQTLRRACDAEGRKLKKLSTGRMGDGAVRLIEPDGAEALIIAEGVETALSLQRLLLARGLETACWATLGLSRFTSITLPAAPSSLIVAADQGEAAAAKCAALKIKAEQLGWTANVATPPEKFDDWNDALIAEQRYA